MPFWNQSTLEPKRKFRWLLNTAISNFQFVAKSATKPGFSISESSMKYINHTFYYPGRLEWGTIDITLVDALNTDMDVSKTLWNMLLNAGYVLPSSGTPQVASTSAFLKANMVGGKGSLGTVQLQQLTGEALGDFTENASVRNWESWKLHNAWVKDVKFGDYTYDSEEAQEVSITLRYDWAELLTGAGAVNFTDQNTGLGPPGQDPPEPQ